jgi:hypothetical protein
MDTDDLTSMAYKCILYALETTDVLKTEFGDGYELIARVDGKL